MTNRLTRLTVLALAGLLVMSMAIPAPVAADHKPGPLEELLSDDQDEDSSGIVNGTKEFGSKTASLATGITSGLWERGPGLKTLIFGAEAPDLDREANDTIEVVNNNSELLVGYVNNHTSTGHYDQSEYNVHKITLVDETHQLESTFYIVGTTGDNTNEWESLEAVSEYDGTVDHEHRLTKDLAKNASGETEYFVENFAETGDEIDDEYKGRMVGKYGGLFGNHAQSTMLDDGWDGSDS